MIDIDKYGDKVFTNSLKVSKQFKKDSEDAIKKIVEDFKIQPDIIKD